MFKRVIKVGVTLVVLGGLITACMGVMFGGNTNSKGTAIQSDSGADKPVKTHVSKVTKANYDLIVQGKSFTGEGGSTYEEVIALLGTPTTVTESEITGIDGQPLKQVDCAWYTLAGDSINVGFTSGKVTFKMYSK